MLEQTIFLILAFAAVFTSVMTITRRSPVAAAMWMVSHFAMLGGLYLTLKAQFIAVIQVLVYAGAIMVLVLFVIMLLNMTSSPLGAKRSLLMRAVTLGAAAALGLEIIAIVWSGTSSGPQGLPASALAVGTVESIGTVLYTTYAFPFEAVSFVLLAAIIGAVVLAKKKLD
jgi:NADH-quinone oxidoreductase subunit J